MATYEAASRAPEGTESLRARTPAPAVPVPQAPPAAVLSTGSGRRGFAPLLKPVVFAISCAPLLKLVIDAAGGHLTANPIAEVLNRFGFWTLTFLLLSLTPTPLKTLLGWTAPMRVRRMLGLFAFSYATLHFLTYLAVDQGLDFGDIGRDIVKRPFITVGFTAFLLLVPLAITSTDRSVRRLGFRRWKRLHRLVYVAAVLGVIHFIWRVKADLLRPTIFAVLLALLFAVRIASAVAGRTSAVRGAAGPKRAQPKARA